MAIQVETTKPRKVAQLDAEPTDAKPTPLPSPPVAPIIDLKPLLADQTKTSIDGKMLGIEGSGHLLEFSVTNVSDGNRYLMLFDQANNPGEGARPKRVWTITTLQHFDGVWPAGRPFHSGLSLILSSTLTTLTTVTAADGIIEATFLTRS